MYKQGPRRNADVSGPDQSSAEKGVYVLAYAGEGLFPFLGKFLNKSPVKQTGQGAHQTSRQMR